MLKDLISRVFGQTKTEPAVAPTVNPGAVHKPSVSAPPRRPGTSAAAPVYPPVDYGIAYDSVDAVIGTQRDLVRRIKLIAGVSDADFDSLFMSVIRNLAEHVNLLPASEVGTHNGPGGLFRLALEIGFYSLQAAEGTIFAGREGIERRRRLEPRWKYASFLAGLCSELHRPFTSMIVVTPDGREWPAFRRSLGEFLAACEVDRYFIRWHPINPRGPSGQGVASYMVYKIIPEHCFQFIADESTVIVPAMLDAITGTTVPGNVSALQRLVTEVRAKVVRRDEAIRPSNYGRVTVGTHIEPHLLDAMRRLVKSGVWEVNQKKSRLWYGEDGLFLVWKTAAKEVLELLSRDGIEGIPKDSQTLLDLLLAAGVFERDNADNPYWPIMPPGASSELIAVKFADPLTLFGEGYEEHSRVGRLFQAANAATPRQEVASVSPPVATSDLTRKSEPKSASQPSSSEPAIQQAELQESSSLESQTERPPAEIVGAPSIALVDEQDVAELPPDLQKLFTPLTRGVLGELLQDHRAGKTKGETAKVADGFAIALERLAGYGADPTAVLQELSKVGWLHTPPELPGKKVHRLRLNNKETTAVIIRPQAAIDAGFMK